MENVYVSQDGLTVVINPVALKVVKGADGSYLKAQSQLGEFHTLGKFSTVRRAVEAMMKAVGMNADDYKPKHGRRNYE